MKSNNFKSFRFFAKSMLKFIRSVILDNLMQKEVELVCKPEVEFLRLRIDLHSAWLLKDTALVRKLRPHPHTMPDKFENATLRAKTEQMFCVHT